MTQREPELRLSPTGAMNSEMSALPAQPKTPQIADHELIRPIGRGAYGQVWLARSVTGAYRAIKVVYRDSFADPRPYEREFSGIQKYEPVSRSHEILVAILHVGRNDSEGFFYYVMELADDAAEGPTAAPPDNPSPESPESHASTADSELTAAQNWNCYIPRSLGHELKQRGRLPFEECLQLGLKLSLALGHLHRHGLLHRDIKPSNVIFVNGVPKLADPGLVTGIEDAQSIVGTEGYIPPEGPTTPSADLFSLGKVLYEMCMGKDRKDFPEAFTNIEQANESEGLMELNAIVLKACELHLKDRYQSAEEMHVDLALVQSGRSVKQKYALEKQLALVSRIGIAATVIAIGASAGYFYQQHQTATIEGLMEAEVQLRKRAEAERERAQQLELESNQRLIRMHTAAGVHHLEKGELLSALLWFVQALKAGEGPGEKMHRTRIGNVLRQLPTVTHAWFPQTTIAEEQFSPDGKWIAIVDDHDRSFQLWDSHSAQPATAALKQPAPIKFVLFSPDSKFVALATRDKSIRLYETETGRQSGPDLSHPGTVQSLNFSADSRRLITACDDSVARMWKVRDATLVRSLPHPQSLLYAQFSPDGRYAATACEDNNVRLWSADDGSELSASVVPGPPESPRVVRFNPKQSQLMAVVGARVGLWDTSSGMLGEPRLLDMRGWWIYDADYSPDGTRIITWSRDATARLWDSKTGQLLLTPIAHDHAVIKAAFSPNGRRFLTLSADGLARVWDTVSGGLVSPPLPHRSDVFPSFGKFSADGRRFLVSGRRSTRIYDLAHDTVLWSAHLPYAINRVAFDDTGSHVILSGEYNMIQMFDALSGREINGDRKLADQLPRPLNPNFSRLMPNLLPGVENQRALVRSPNSNRELVVQGNSVTVRDAKTRRQLIPIIRHREGVTYAAFSPDGTRIVTCSFDLTARVWDAATGEPLGPPLHHLNAVNFAAFSPDGNRLATVCRMNNFVAIWDISPELRPVEQLAALTEWLSERTINELSQVVWQEPDAGSPKQQWDSLHELNPADFAMTPSEYWHFENSLQAMAGMGVDVAMAELDPAVDPKNWRRRAHLFQTTGSLPMAAENWVKAIEFEPGDSHLRFQYGTCLYALQRAPESLDQFSEAIRLNPGMAIYHHWRAKTHAALGAWTAALEEASIAVALQPGSPELWEHKARLHSRLKQWPEALSDYEQCRRVAEGPAGKNTPPLVSLLPAVQTTPEMVDLTPFFNVSLTDTGEASPWPTMNLTELPLGIQKFAGVNFDVRGGIHLTSLEVMNRGSSFPWQVHGIPVRRKCAKIHFLYACRFSDSPGELVGKFVIRFPDGTNPEQLIFYDEHVRDFWLPGVRLKSAEVAFTLNRETDSQTLYKTTWINPKPDQEILTIDFIAIRRFASPVLIAITTEN